MKINHLKTNHIVNPIGFEIRQPIFSYVIIESTGICQKEARILIARDKDMTDIVYDTGMSEDISSIGYKADITLTPATRYFWKVIVTADNGDTGESEVAYFETAKAVEKLRGSFILQKKATMLIIL